VNTVMNESSGSIQCGEFVTEQSRCWVRKGDALRGGGFGCNRVVLCDQYRLLRPGAVSTLSDCGLYDKRVHRK
jgi:hypothetical protein